MISSSPHAFGFFSTNTNTQVINVSFQACYNLGTATNVLENGKIAVKALVWMKIQVLNGTTNDFTNLALSMTGKIVKLTSVGQLTIGLE